MKKVNVKNQSAITLIALIITIIVMLILVAVTIRMVINSNILGTTQNVGQEYELAKTRDELETDLAAMTIDKKYKNKGTTKTYYDYLVEKYGAENVTTIIEGKRYQVEYQGHNIDVSVNDNDELKLADALEIKWIYEDNGDGTANITGIDLSAYKDFIDTTATYSPITLDIDNDTLIIPGEINGKTIVNFSWDESYFGGELCDKIMGIKKIVFPDSIKTIEGQYMYMDDLEEAELSDNLEVIGAYMFGGCLNIESIVIPASVKEIETSAFLSCTNLKDVTFLGSPEVIGYGAFMCCGFESITLGDGVITIEAHAFDDATKPDRPITLPSTIETIGEWAFGMGIGAGADVTFPEGMSDALKTEFESHKTDLWGANSITIIEDGVTTTYPQE